ncbi:hypothetical protein FQA39_LY08562 [Lamprigera yunnana]|nr:hypothetical protein FQA39_LY08562 [Lamprigera yunnana]
MNLSEKNNQVFCDGQCLIINQCGSGRIATVDYFIQDWIINEQAVLGWFYENRRIRRNRLYAMWHRKRLVMMVSEGSGRKCERRLHGLCDLV